MEGREGAEEKPVECSRACCGSCCRLWIAWYFYWIWNAYTCSLSPWHMFEPSSPTCADRKSDLPANNSGIRVLVYGLSKTGTTTMARSLYHLGLRHSYHSEDISYHVFSRIADRFWLRPENGGRRAGTAHGIYMFYGRSPLNLNLEYSDDEKVLASLAPEELAASLAGCKVDSIAFDGVEHLFWPIYDVSPDAKVLILDWRTVNEWNNSRTGFAPLLMLSYIEGGVISSSILAAPMVVVVAPWIDWLFGSPGYRHALEGGPPLGVEPLGIVGSLYIAPLVSRRLVTHTYAGLKELIFTDQGYEDYYKAPYERIPPERRMSWDMRKHGWEDMCAFLDVPAKDCPGKGRLPNVSQWSDKFYETLITCIVINVVCLLLHWVNWQVFQAGLTAFSSLFGWLWGRSGLGGRSALSME